MSGAPSPSWSRAVAPTLPTSTSTCSSGSPASPSTATSGSLSTWRPSTTPTTGTTRRLPLSTPTGPGAKLEKRRLSPGTSAAPSTTWPSPPTVMATVTVTASTSGAKAARDLASTVSPILPGPLPGRVTPACTSSPASPRVWSTPSSTLFLRASPLCASGGDRVATTGPPSTSSAGRRRLCPRQLDDVGRQQGQGSLDRQELAPVCPRHPQGWQSYLVQRYLPIRA